MQIDEFSFGSIRIGGVTFNRDIVIDRGEVRERKKKQSKRYRDEFGHTPLSNDEELPWKCRTLVVGAGAYGSLPVMDEVREEAKRRKVSLIILPTAEAIEHLNKGIEKTNAVLHITC